MLFDLEDYRYGGIVGKDHFKVHQVRWDDARYTFIATLDAYSNSVEYYGSSAITSAPASEKSTILEKYFLAIEKLSFLKRNSKDFWNAMCSIAIVGSYNEGDKFDYTTVYIDEVVDGVDYQDLTWRDENRIMNPYKFVAFRHENGEFEYRTMTQALYDSYYTAIADVQSAVKALMLNGEGVSTFEEFVPPVIPVWNDGAELSGYVRDSRSLPISGATVRLVDADGVNHDLVTNDLGYYHFTKEYIYNNISFGTASSVEFDMFVLEETISGTVLYNQTNIFQNSFFGALNDRDLTWPVLVKSGKQNRRNFKIEVIPDYSAYPSLSGHVYDQDGNPVTNAFVELKYYTGQGIWLGGNETEYDWVNIGYTYDKVQGPGPKWNKTTKYTLFGEEKSLLTDENGYYEYPAQLFGQWYNDLKRMWRDLGVSDEWTLSDGLLYNPNIAKNGFHIDEDFLSGNGLYGDGQYQSGWVYASDVQSDGKVVAGGDISNYNGVDLGYTIPETIGLTDAYGYPSIMRLNTDGSLDQTFETGIRNLRVYNGDFYDNPYIQFIKVLSDDKILVAGNFNKVEGEHANGLVLLNADGTKNTIFEVPRSNTELQTNSYFSIEYYGTDPMMWVDKLSDGRFIAYTYNTDILYVFNADGTLDTNFSFNFSFGGDILTANMGTWNSQNRQIDGVLPLDGGFILYGIFYVLVDGELFTSHIVKVNNDGTLDTSFKCIVGSYYGFDMQGYVDTHTDANLDTPVFYADSGRVKDVIKTNNATLILSGDFGYTKVFANGTETDTKVRNIIRVDMDGNLLDRFDSAPDPSSAIEMTYGDVNAEMGIPVNGKINIVDTLNSYPGSVNYYSDNGKKLFIHDRWSSGLAWTLDLATGVSEQVGIFFNNQIQSSTLTNDNKLVIFGQFKGYWEQVAPYLDSDGFANRYMNDRFGIVRFEYGAYNHSSEKYLPVSLEITSSTNPNSKVNKQFTINDVKILLNPWVQNSVTGEVYNENDKNNGVLEPSKIYDYEDWFNSRFAYSFNERGEQYAIKLNGGVDKDVVLDINEVLTEEEAGAERLRMKLVKNWDGYGSGYWDAQTITFKSTTGYVRVKGALGDFIIGSGATGSAYDENFTLNDSPGEGQGGYINFSILSNQWDNLFNNAIPNPDGTYDVYFYSCEPEHGAASGYITYVNPYHLMCTEFDVSEMAHLEYLRFASRLILQNPTSEENTFPLDVSGCVGLKAFSAEEFWSFKLNVTGLNQLHNLEYLRVDGEVYTSKVSVPGEFQYVTDMSQVRRGSSSPSDRTGIAYANDVIKMSDGKYVVVANNSAYESDIYGHVISLPNMRSIMRVNPDDMSFDTTFNNYYRSNTDGIQRGFSGNAFCVDKQSDDKLIVGGDFWEYNEQQVPKGIVRLRPDGSRDTSFNTSGIQVGEGVYSIKVLPDDKILIMGPNIYHNNNGNYYGLMKLNSNGSIDTSFILSSIHTEVQSTRRISIQSSGKILVQTGNYIKRLNPNGTIDTSFTQIFTNGNATTIAVLSDDSFIVSGYDVHTYETASGQSVGCSFAKYDIDGALNHEFTKKAAKYRFEWSNVSRVIILSDDTIVLTENFTKYKFNDIDVDSPDELVIDSDFNSDYIYDIKLVLDSEGNVISGDYLPITTGWPTAVTLQNIIEDGDTLIMVTNNQMPIRTTGGQSEETYIQGLGKFIKRPKTRYRFDRPSSSSLKILRERTMNSNPVVSNVPNLVELSVFGDSKPSVTLNNLGNLERLYMFSLGYTLQKITGATLLTDGTMTKLKSFYSYTNIFDNYSFLASPDLNKVQLDGWGKGFPISSTYTNQILQYAIDGEETGGQIQGRFSSDVDTPALISTLNDRGWYISFW